MATTIRDVAQRAGVSSATGSLVLSGKEVGRVSAATAARVREAAEVLGYQRQRRRGDRGAGLLGLISVASSTSPHSSASVEAALLAARRHDLDVLVVDLPDVGDLEAGMRRLTGGRNVGTLIVSGCHRPLQLPDSLPGAVVLIGNPGDRRDVDAVAPAEYLGQRAVLAQLAQAGHTRIGWLGSRSASHTSEERLAAFRDAALDHAWDVGPSRVVLMPGADSQHGYKAMRRLLSTDPDTTAVACETDRAAMGAYQACWEQGLRIPQDVSIVGFDDEPAISQGLRPGLTSVMLPHHAVGQWAVDRLVDRIDSPGLTPCQVLLSGHVVVRGSVAPARGRSRPAPRAHEVSFATTGGR